MHATDLRTLDPLTTVFSQIQMRWVGDGVWRWEMSALPLDCSLQSSEPGVFIVWMENQKAEMSAGKGKRDWRAILENSRQ